MATLYLSQPRASSALVRSPAALREAMQEIFGTAWNWPAGANMAEAALWGIVAAGFLVAAVRPRLRMMKLAAGAAFLAFGASDVVEAHTGAWWRPWWLLAWKAACVAVMLWLLCGYLRLARRGR